MKEIAKVSNILISDKEISEAVKKIASQINRDCGGDELIVVGVLKGCFVFMADLIKELECDTRICFMEASSYGNGTVSSGKLKIKKDIEVDIADRNILIVEDIVDSGNTLSALKAHFEEKNPKSIKVAALLSKPSRRQVEIEADYTGFVIEDKFIVGYGLDYAEKFRNLPYIAEIDISYE